MYLFEKWEIKFRFLFHLIRNSKIQLFHLEIRSKIELIPRLLNFNSKALDFSFIDFQFNWFIQSVERLIFLSSPIDDWFDLLDRLLGARSSPTRFLILWEWAKTQS
jgi:hypothetical protein